MISQSAPQSAATTPRSDSANASEVKRLEDTLPSIPLYLAGMAVTICGVLAVTLTVSDSNLTMTTVLLTIIGFVFSYGCRYLKLRLYVAQILVVGTAVYFVYSFLSGNIDWRAFMLRNQLDFAVMFAWALTAWSWALVGDGMVLLSALLAFTTIGLVSSIDISGAVPYCFMVLLAGTFFLLGHYQYLQKRSRASRDAGDSSWPSSRRPWEVQIAVAASVSLIVFLGASLLAIPAQMVFGGASLAEAVSGLSSIGPIINPTQSGPTVDDGDDMLIGTGSGLGADSAVFAYAEPSDGQAHYWRARTYDIYTGSGWQSSLGGRQIPFWHSGDGAHSVYTLRQPSPPPDSAEITTLFETVGSTNEMFYTGEPDQVMFNSNAPEYFYPLEPALHRDGQLMLVTSDPIHFNYSVKSTVLPDASSVDQIVRLRACGQDFTPDIREMYIDNLDNAITTPDDIAYFQKTVKKIIDSLPRQHRAEIDKTMAIRDFVSRQAVYSLNVAALPAGQDHVRAFLEQTKKGYCDLFASSMAVLCRVAGIPARLATGFLPGTDDGSRYTLRGSDKHAWVEVYFNGYGWLTFDPTMAAEVDGSVSKTTERHSVSFLHWNRLFLARRGMLVPIILALILSIALYIVKVELWDARRRRGAKAAAVSASRGELGRRYERMLQSIAHLGLRKKRAETPLEFAARAVPYLEKLQADLGTPIASDQLTAITECYVALRYGDDRVKRSVSFDFSGAVDQFVRGAAKARWRHVFRRRARA